ncbi:MAG: PepSY domain-containing protein [Lysobacter sp.]
MNIPAVHRPSPWLLAIVLLVLFATSVGNAMAQARGSRGPVERGGRSEERQADHRALSDAVRRVERATGGEVLSAERVQSDGRDVSRVKVVDASGRVRVYMDDAQQQPRDRRKDRTRRDDSNND